MRAINNRRNRYIVPAPPARCATKASRTKAPAPVDLFDRQPVFPTPFQPRGAHLLPRSRRKVTLDKLQRASGALVRGLGRIINTLIPFSIITDAIVFPSWSMGANRDELESEGQALQRKYKGTPITIPVRNYAVGVPLPGFAPLLSGMHFPAENPATKKTVIFCNPNAAYWEQAEEMVDFYNRELGCNVVVFNYRGASESQGRPTASRTLKDMNAVLKRVTETYRVSDKDILVHGRSVGGPHAAYIASKHPEMTLVCDRTFTNLASAAKHMTGGGAKGSIVGGLAYTFAADDISTHAHYQKVKGPKLCIADHHDEKFPNYRGDGGDVIDLNCRYPETHNDWDTTFKSRLVKRWIVANFMRR